MRNHIWIAMTFSLIGACTNANSDLSAERKAAAERYFRGVYECDSSVVDLLAADSLVVSWPIFHTLFGKPVLKGRQEVTGFADRFCKRWIDAETTVDQLIYEGDTVVMVWSFQAKNGIPGEDGSLPTFEETKWGGITVFRFNEAGKIVLEVGEESRPGPFGRLK